MSEALVIKNGRLLDPSSRTDATRELRLENGVIAEVGAPGSLSTAGATVLDANGKWVLPGLIDMHVHLREPGEEYKEDIASGSRAAAAGGFTTIVAMANTKPVADNAEVVSFVVRRAQEVGLARVLPVGAISVGLVGEVLTPAGELKNAGAVALSDDGKPVWNARLMRHALEYSQDFNLPVLSHAEDRDLSKGGYMHEGEVSTRLGLRGVPGISEEIAIARDLMLAKHTGGRLHIQHVSTRGAVELIRRAKQDGVRVTAEATPHHFTLTDEAVTGYNTNAKMSPPLRSEEDRQAVVAGLADGTLDVIATDHAPHSVLEKDTTFDEAANGIIGLQTALPLALELWRSGALPILAVIERLTWAPARALGLPYGTLARGAPADVTIVDPDASYVFSEDLICSKSKNSPFIGRTLRGRVEATILGGKTTYQRVVG
jgi:dihydroorotase